MRRAITISGVVVVTAVVASIGIRTLARSRTYQLFSRPIAHVTTADSVVALTFDDGPTMARVDSLIGILASRDVHATFFLIGAELASASDAGKALVAAGHELGNHTYSHDHMVFKTMRTYREQISRTDSLLHIAGAHDPILFRPPYGYKLIGLPFVLSRMGRKTVTWDIEPESFPEVAKSAAGIVRHVVSRVRPGSIILLHPWYTSGAATRAAVPVLIDSLRARGYRITTVSDLLAHGTR